MRKSTRRWSTRAPLATRSAVFMIFGRHCFWTKVAQPSGSANEFAPMCTAHMPSVPMECRPTRSTCIASTKLPCLPMAHSTAMVRPQTTWQRASSTRSMSGAPGSMVASTSFSTMTPGLAATTALHSHA
eukprot:CAMPEP_0175305502 /NCGR_PEP_ID=MMETSP0093-20121207/63777_1 /TAXON_ID=311494 /ORGANISM="Alexandrium monilatum, Strain CCMP3105" /LENGTH=128 /DNA_ID=CAMNT_0016601931 /DNA_START=98 /DNA_END=484 /DNA_ORIENTATION=-